MSNEYKDWKKDQETRDHYLITRMGLCYHKVDISFQGDYGQTCILCGKRVYPRDMNFSFNDWTAFGLLWEWASDQYWWEDFLHNELSESCCMDPMTLINPSRFADEIEVFLVNNHL